MIDCADPERLAGFWGEVLGAGRFETDGDPVHYADIAAVAPGAPGLIFQRVPEPKSVKNRLHLDLYVDDVEEATAFVESLGGSRDAAPDFEEYGFRWRVMRDPEGNEFCLVFVRAGETPG